VEFYGNQFPLHSLVLKLTVENILNCSKNCFVAVQNHTSVNHLRRLARIIFSNESCRVSYTVSTHSMGSKEGIKQIYGNITDKLAKSIHSGYFDINFHAKALSTNDTALQKVVCGNTTSTSYSVSEPKDTNDNIGTTFSNYVPPSDVILSGVLPTVGLLLFLLGYCWHVQTKSAKVWTESELPDSELKPGWLCDIFPLFGVCVAQLYSSATFTKLLLNFPLCCGHFDLRTPRLIGLTATALGITCLDVIVLSLWVISAFDFMYKTLHYYCSILYQLLSLILLWILVDHLGYYSPLAGIAALCVSVYSGYDFVQNLRKYGGKTAPGSRLVVMLLGLVLTIVGFTPILIGLTLGNTRLIYNPQSGYDVDPSADGWVHASDGNSCTNFYLYSSSVTAMDGGMIDQYCTPNTTILSTHDYKAHRWEYSGWNLNKGCCYWHGKP
jgi:hypothetical protein